eukprot:CAMPEP_0119197254 /NCGR_PEP_ID=MMETSP1316-20130426/13197_1 /TAXON_ID=41880 /ORGANISM="Pycnococcus provasolii, Strain RCC2336" /LENGTH=1235 /DNA_ID=CAMNT_0007193039 /DNA_START=21 /DNA_END=3730 /DNA_ORIENTATION=+
MASSSVVTQGSNMNGSMGARTRTRTSQLSGFNSTSTRTRTNTNRARKNTARSAQGLNPRAAAQPHSSSSSSSEKNKENNAAAARLKAATSDAAAAPTTQTLDASGFPRLPLPSHPDIIRGEVASNGLRYVILPNPVPPDRFEAHLEVHAGSVDEMEKERGLAHLVEHVTFLGSRKRESLLGTGSRSNAYTDFHHTVFHVHAPIEDSSRPQDGPLLPRVLDALHEIAFAPQFLSSRIEKERRAVLAEAQMMNTIDYRVDCQLLAKLHAENELGVRFPIGLEEQIEKWDEEMLREYHRRWYFPANCTLYLVGDFGVPVDEVKNCIDAAFARAPAKVLDDGEQRAKKHEVRPPVRHVWGAGERLPLDDLPESLTPHLFCHELLEQYMLNVFCKVPAAPVRNHGDLRRVFLQRIVLSVLQFRISSLYQRLARPCFTSIELDHSDSGREGCAVSTLTVTSEPADWEDATRIAVQELRRLQKFGVTQNELQRYTDALLRDSEQLAEQHGTVPSIDNLDFVMESDALGHIVMDQRQGHDALLNLAEDIQLSEVNEQASAMLSFVANYGCTDRTEMRYPVVGDEPPTWTTAVVACVPMSDEGCPGMSEEALAAVLADDSVEIEPVVDVDVPDQLIPDEQLAALVESERPHFVMPGGLSREEAASVTDPANVVVGNTYLRRLSNGISVNYQLSANEPCGAALRLVFTGGRCRESQSAPSSVSVGARALSETGCVGPWSREQVELYSVSRLINCSLEVDEEFACLDVHFAVSGEGLRGVMELLHLWLSSPKWDESAFDRSKEMHKTHYRSVSKSLEKATADGILRELVQEDPRFVNATPASIDALVLDECRNTMLAQMRPENIEVSIVGDFSPAELDELLLSHLGTVGFPAAGEPGVDAKVKEAEAPILLSPPLPLGEGLRRRRLFLRDSDERACAVVVGACPGRWAQLVTHESSAELRENVAVNPTVAMTSSFAGPSDNGLPALIPTELDPRLQAEELISLPDLSTAMGPGAAARAVRRSHPLYVACALSIGTEIANSRLFTTVRDALGLTYDVSVELFLPERMRRGWYQLSVTSTPAKIDMALDSSIRTLRGMHVQRPTSREVDRARRTLLTRHESDEKDNAYLVGLSTHVQNGAVPLKTASLVQDVAMMYAVIDEQDVSDVWGCINLSEEAMIACLGVSGPDVDRLRMEAEVEEEEAAKAKAEQAKASAMPQMTAEQMAAFGKILKLIHKASWGGGTTGARK